MKTAYLRYTLEIAVPEDPDGVTVMLGRDGHQVERATSALSPALDIVLEGLRRDLEEEING